MATTVSTTDYNGNGSTTAYSFTFPYLKTEDVKVALNGKTLATTEYTFATATSIQLSSISGSLNAFQTNTQNSSGAPLNGVKVLIYRDTDVAAAKAVFASGSSFRATDLNNNKEQSLYTEQELKDPSNPNNEPNTINGEGNPGQGVGFEGNLYFDTTNNLLFGPKENGAWGTGTPISATSTESIQDIVGAMFSGNTETNITATYQDSDGTIDLVSTDTNTQLTTEEVQDIVGGMFSGNTETNITATYQDSDGTIDLVASNTNTQLSNEQVQDIAGAMFSSNTENGVTVTYQDGDGTIDLEVTSLYSSGNKKVEATNTGATVTGKLTVTGDLQIDGTTTTVNSTTMKVDDKNIVLGAGAINDAAADGGGITLESGDRNKTFNWVDSTDAWTSSEHIHVGDSKKLLVGTGSDLQIYHNSSHSFIERVSGGTGNLYIRAYDSGSVAIETGDGSSGSENAIVCNGNSSVDLYHSGTSKLSTTASGARVYGQLTIESDLNFMGGSDSTRYIDARLGDNNALTLRGTTGGDVSPWETLAEFFRGGGTKFYYDGGGTPTLEVTATGTRVYGQLTVEDQLNFMGGSDSTRYIDARVGDGNALTIRGTTGGDGSHETLAEFFRGGSSGVKLYHNNSSKLETTSAGATVTGTLTATTFSGSGANLTDLPGGNTTFTQTGTGAVSRTVDAKLKDTINVWDFIPSGTTTASTDCASYFQAAINTGKVVYVPKGTYRIDSTLVLDGGYESLIGDASMPRLLKWTEGPAIQISEPGGTGLNEWSRVENFYIQRKIGGSFTCPNYNATLTESLAGVVVSGHGAGVAAAVQKTRISNLRVGNFAVGFFFADCVGVTVHKCFTQNLGDYTNATSTADGTTITSSMWGVGFYFNATRYASGSISPLASIEIVECDDVRQNDPTTIKSVSYLVVGEDIRDIFFTNAESSHADYGYYISGLTNDDLNWDVHIIRPIIDTFKKHAIYINNVDGVGAVSVIGGYYVGVEGAEASIYASNSNGISISGGAQLLGLTNHDGTNNTDDGIRLDSCTSCSIIGNRFANLQYAISLNNTTFSTIQGNVISAAVTGEDAQDPSLVEAIRLFGNSTFNTVGNNTIRGLSASVKYTKGIVLASGSDNCKLIGNIIDGTTVTTQVDDSASGTGYAGSAGGATGTDYNDSVKVRFGTGNDLELYHDGSHSVIKNSTGSLYAATGAFLVQNAAQTESQIISSENGAVELYYDNSNKLSTTNSGARVYGQLTVEDQLNFMGGSDTTRYIDARLGDGNALTIRGTTGGDVSPWETLAEFYRGGGVKLHYDGAGTKFETTSTGATVYDKLQIGSNDSDPATLEIRYSTVPSYLTSTYDGTVAETTLSMNVPRTSDGSGSWGSHSNTGWGSSAIQVISHSSSGGYLTFLTSSADNTNPTEKLRINPSGHVVPGTDSTYDLGLNGTRFRNVYADTLYGDGSNLTNLPSGGGGTGTDYNDNVKVRFGTGNDLEIYHDGTDTHIVNSTSHLWVETTGDDLVLRAADDVFIQGQGGESGITVVGDGGMLLYYNGSTDPKLATTASGARVYGQLTIEDQLNFMGGSDSARYIDARLGDGNALTLRGTTGGDVSPWETLAEFTRGGAVNLYYDTSKKFETNSGGVNVTGGLNVSGNLHCTADGGKLIAGAGDDLQIYHDGTDNIIDSHQGDLKIISEDNITAIKISEDGTVDIGHNADNIQLRLGAGSDLKLYHDGTHSYIQNATGDLRMAGASVGFTNAAKNEWLLNANENAEAKLYYDNSNKLSTTASGARVYGQLTVEGELNFMGGSDSERIIDARLGDGNALVLRGASGGDSNQQNLAKFYRGGACEFYHDATIAFKTLSGGGLDLYGNISGGDSRQIHLGNDADLQIFHNGSYSYINNSTSWLLIQSDSVALRSLAGTENFVTGVLNGAVELYHNNLKKFETTSIGCKLHDSDTTAALQFTNSAGNNGYVMAESTNILGFKDSQAHWMTQCYKDGGVKLYFDGTKKCETSADGLAFEDNNKVVFGNSGDLKIYHNGSNSEIAEGGTGGLRLLTTQFKVLNNPSLANENMIVATQNGAVQLFYDNSEYLRTFAGGVLINATSTFDSVSYARLQVDGVGNAGIAVTGNGTGGQSRVSFFNPNGRVGYISTSGSSTSYHTSSDYRLKENEVPISDGITRLKTLKPYRFNFKADPTTTVDGFFAHEVTAVPEAIDGKKDGVNMQAIDQSKLVPLLTAALQEAIAKIETLEAEVATLKG